MGSEHDQRHRRIAEAIAARRNLDHRHVDAALKRDAAGRSAYGENAHHAHGFRPLNEALEELWDAFSLGLVFTQERVDLGIAGRLDSAEKRKCFAEFEWHLCGALQNLGRLVDDDE